MEDDSLHLHIFTASCIITFLSIISVINFHYRNHQADRILASEHDDKLVLESSKRPIEKTFHQRLHEAGYSEDEIINHKKLSFFYDPISHELTENPVVTNTENIVDQSTAVRLVHHGLRLFSEKKVTDFTGVPALRKLLNELVTDAINEKTPKKIKGPLRE